MRRLLLLIVSALLLETGAAVGYEDEPSDIKSADDDVFSASYCTSRSLTESDAMCAIDPPRAIEATIGKVQFAGRQRRCYKVGGCLPWVPIAKATDSIFTNSGFDRLAPLLSASFPLIVRLRYDVPVLRFSGNLNGKIDDPPAGLVTFGRYLRLDTNYFAIPKTETSALRFSFFGDSYRRYSETTSSQVAANSAILAPVLIGRSDPEYKGHIGRDCLWFQQSSRYNKQDADGNHYDVDTELVIFGKIGH